MIQGGRDQLWQRKEFKTNERTMMRGEGDSAHNASYASSSREAIEKNKQNGLGRNGEGRKGWGYDAGGGGGKEDKKRRGIQLGLKTILDAGEEGAKVGELHIFDPKLILQRVCIVSSDICYMRPFAVL